MSAAKWNSIGSFVRTALQFGIGIVLARLVGPHDFGLVAIAFLMIGFGQLFVDFGFNAAIIQVRDLRQGDVDCLGTLQIIVGGAMSAIGMIIAGPLAGFFSQPEAVPVIRAMSMMFVLRAVGQTSIALLSRDLNFRAIQISSLGGYVIGYILVGVTMACLGYGVWSVVAAQLVQASLTSVIGIVQHGSWHRLTLKGLRRDMLIFGRLVLSANISSWALWNVDSMLVGHFMGSTSLAFYNRSVMLASASPMAVLSGLQGVLFAVFSRAQDNPDGCRRTLYAAIEGMFLILSPLLFAISVTSHTLMLALYGDEWLGAAPLLGPLCVAWLFTAVLALLGPLIMGLGRAEVETRAQWLMVLIMLPVIYFSTQLSLAAVAWSTVVLSLLRLLMLIRGVNAILPLDYGRMLRSATPCLFVGVAAAGGAALADWLLRGQHVSVMLAGDIVGAALATIASSLLACRALLAGDLGALILTGTVLPDRYRRWLHSLAGKPLEAR